MTEMFVQEELQKKRESQITFFQSCVNKPITSKVFQKLYENQYPILRQVYE